MTRRRLIVDGLIVVAVIGLLVTPYLVPERVGAWRGGYSLARCTQFAVTQESVVSGDKSGRPQSHWKASITVSNVGPHRAELLPATILSRFKTGTKSWPVAMPGNVLRPGEAASITIRFPMSNTNAEGPRVWELEGQYRTRDSKAMEWIQALHNRLPRDRQLDLFIYRLGTYQGRLQAHYPENYHSILTNELGSA